MEAAKMNGKWMAHWFLAADFTWDTHPHIWKRPWHHFNEYEFLAKFVRKNDFYWRMSISNDFKNSQSSLFLMQFTAEFLHLLTFSPEQIKRKRKKKSGCIKRNPLLGAVWSIDRSQGSGTCRLQATPCVVHNLGTPGSISFISFTTSRHWFWFSALNNCKQVLN